MNGWPKTPKKSRTDNSPKNAGPVDHHLQHATRTRSSDPVRVIQEEATPLRLPKHPRATPADGASSRGHLMRSCAVKEAPELRSFGNRFSVFRNAAAAAHPSCRGNVCGRGAVLLLILSFPLPPCHPLPSLCFPVRCAKLLFFSGFFCFLSISAPALGQPLAPRNSITIAVRRACLPMPMVMSSTLHTASNGERASSRKSVAAVHLVAIVARLPAVSFRHQQQQLRIAFSLARAII